MTFTSLWEDPLMKEITTHFSIIAWEIPWTEEPGRLQFMGSQRVSVKLRFPTDPSLPFFTFDNKYVFYVRKSISVL